MSEKELNLNDKTDELISNNDFASVGTEELNEEQKRVKRRNEYKAYFFGLISQIIWAVNAIQLKTYQNLFPEVYSLNSLVFYRSFCIFIIAFFVCKYKKINVRPIRQIKSQFWFWLRSLGNYMGVILWILLITFLRVGTGQCIANTNPVFVLILSTFLLKEKFYIRYLVGIVLSFLGSLIMILNEKSANPNKISSDSQNQSNQVLKGCLVAVSHLSFLTLFNFGQKILVKEGLLGDEQNYYLGLFNALPAFIVISFQRWFGLSNIYYVLYALSNGIVFYLGNFFGCLALKYISMTKFLPLTYVNIVFIFIFGFMFLHEKIFLSDVLGCSLIIGFQIYNVYFTN